VNKWWVLVMATSFTWRPRQTGRSSTLEDLARYALIYTPSWSVVSDEQIVSSAILKSLQTSGSHEAHIKGDFTEHSWFHDALSQDMPYRNSH